ncbi:MAG: flagellar biosynthetic protein FliR [Armatimonadota bacterium]
MFHGYRRRQCGFGSAPGQQRALSKVFVDLVASIFSVGLRLAAPVMAAVFLTDLGFGFIARVVPQMNVFLVGIPAKMLVGLVVLSFSAPLLVYTVGRLIVDLKETMYLMIQLMG